MNVAEEDGAASTESESPLRERRTERSRTATKRFAPVGKSSARIEAEIARGNRRRKEVKKEVSTGGPQQQRGSKPVRVQTRKKTGIPTPRFLSAAKERAGSPVPGSKLWDKRVRDAERKRLMRTRDRATRSLQALSRQKTPAARKELLEQVDQGERDPVEDEPLHRRVEADQRERRLQQQPLATPVGSTATAAGSRSQRQDLVRRRQLQNQERLQREEKEERQLQQERELEEAEEERMEMEAQQEEQAHAENLERSAKARHTMKAWVLGAFERAQVNHLEIGGVTEALLLFFLQRWWGQIGDTIQESRNGPSAARRFFVHLRDHHFAPTFMDGLDRALHECGEKRTERQESEEEEESEGEM